MINRIRGNGANAFDLTDTETTIRDVGLPTADHVAKLEADAQRLYNEEKGRTAIDALEAYARAANAFANIVAAGLRPFYDASHEDQQSLPASEVSKLAKYEQLANDYRRKRDRAYVMQAQCYVAVGELEKAVPLLMKALELLPISESKWWSHARTLLYRIVGVSDG